jgi:uncharacterized SAM-binding protein YcdF (DUF218 family)
LRAPSSKPYRRALDLVAIAGVAAGVAVLAGLIWFAIPPAAENRPAATDAIVVLTGASLRLPSGIDLLREGKGRMLFVSGVARHINVAELLHRAGEDSPEWLTCCIVIGHDAENTVGNAIETARWMRQQGFHSLRLVTSWYHMPRSLLEFGRAMPDVKIVPHPVFSDQVKRENWWAWHGTAGLLIEEYGKYLVALFLPVVERSSWSDPRLTPSEAPR